MAFDLLDYNAYSQICAQYPGIFVVMADGTMPSYYHKVGGQWKNTGNGLHVVTRYVAFDDAAVMINQESKFTLHTDPIFGHQYVCGPEILNLLRPLVKKGCPCIGIGADGTIRYQFKVSVGVKPLDTSVSGVDDDEVIE